MIIVFADGDTSTLVSCGRSGEGRVRTSLRISSLPTGLTLDGFDFGFQSVIDKKRIETLATGNYMREKETVLFQGPPGVGKTHLAVALGIKAIQSGFSAATTASMTCCMS